MEVRPVQRLGEEAAVMVRPGPGPWRGQREGRAVLREGSGEDGQDMAPQPPTEASRLTARRQRPKTMKAFVESPSGS